MSILTNARNRTRPWKSWKQFIAVRLSSWAECCMDYFKIEEGGENRVEILRAIKDAGPL